MYKMNEIREFLLSTKELVANRGLSYRLLKNGVIWDYTQHPQDIVDWWEKILREDPEATLDVEFATYEEMYVWKTGERG